MYGIIPQNHGETHDCKLLSKLIIIDLIDLQLVYRHLVLKMI